MYEKSIIIFPSIGLLVSLGEFCMMCSELSLPQCPCVCLWLPVCCNHRFDRFALSLILFSVILWYFLNWTLVLSDNEIIFIVQK